MCLILFALFSPQPVTSALVFMIQQGPTVVFAGSTFLGSLSGETRKNGSKTTTGIPTKEKYFSYEIKLILDAPKIVVSRRESGKSVDCGPMFPNESLKERGGDSLDTAAWRSRVT